MNSPKFDRRQLLKMATWWLLTTAFSGIVCARVNALSDLRVYNHRMPQHILPPDFSDFSLIIRGDMHLGSGNFSDEAHVRDAWFLSMQTARQVSRESQNGAVFGCHVGDILTYTPNSQIWLSSALGMAEKFFAGMGLSTLAGNFGVFGNHDVAHPDIGQFAAKLAQKNALGMNWLLDVERKKWDPIIRWSHSVQLIPYSDVGGGAGDYIHFWWIHTSADYLHQMKKGDRDAVLDYHIEELNRNLPGRKLNVFIGHNPDFLWFLLQRLKETHQKLLHGTLCLSGHSHGWFIDVPIIRDILLSQSGIFKGHYKWWSSSLDSTDFSDVWPWAHFVMRGENGSPGHPHFRLWDNNPGFDVITWSSKRI